LAFRFFCGASLRENSYLTFVEDVAQILPREYFEVVPAIAYQDYMRLMETGAIALDSFPVGGCNSVVDSLYLRKPTVVYEGDRWYNRIGAQILRQAGLVELIATTEKDYFNLALKLILDENYRHHVGDRLKKLNFDQTLFNATDAQYFPKAMAYLLSNHDALQQENSRQPIMIERD
jgi:predicted O-linked N-acetylglucosamine transferase (SPINDLY family)